MEVEDVARAVSTCKNRTRQLLARLAAVQRVSALKGPGNDDKRKASSSGRNWGRV